MRDRWLRLLSIAGLICTCVCSVLLSPGSCEEGMWLPNEIPDDVMREMETAGLELTREEIHNASGTGVANAVVSVGATGSFVSPDGLILTNHHVAFGAVQRMSTPEKNYIEEGFLARSRDEEVPAFGYIAYVLQSTEDVTERVFSATDPAMSPRERYDAIERETKAIVAEAEADRDVYCEVNKFYGGARYLLDTYLKIKDVRVVYVPSRAIGEYGGDIDNWMWPRHTGDFSFLRAYVAPDGETAEFAEANVPYRPKRYLEVASDGLSDGDFAMIIGFPGNTRRYMTSHGLARYQDFEYPQRVRLYRKMIDILEKETARDPAGRVRVASRIKGINNRLKNNEGMLEGLERFGLVDRERRLEQEFLANTAAAPEIRNRFGSLLEDFSDLYTEKDEYAMKDLLLELLLGRGSLLSQAMLLYKWSVEKEKDDMDRDPDFMDRKIPDLKRRLRVFQRGLHIGSDRMLMKMFIGEMMQLPESERVQAVEGMMGAEGGPEGEDLWERVLADLYGGTRLHIEEERLRLFDLSHEELLQAGDPFISLAAAFYDENEERLDREKDFLGKLDILEPEWLQVIAEGSRGSIYADANGTKRLNYGFVKGYSPVDTIDYKPFTGLGGVAAKHTGIAPFDCPQRILDLVASRTHGPYFDPSVGDVPVNLLTTHDSTGGNSGSPVLNAKGELVGCLFDGNYEAMTSDFLFMDDLTRSISVDIRYILFVAEFVDGAHNVLQELSLK